MTGIRAVLSSTLRRRVASRFPNGSLAAAASGPPQGRLNVVVRDARGGVHVRNLAGSDFWVTEDSMAGGKFATD